MSCEARHFFSQVEGVRLHWTEFGSSGTAPPVVLLHGLKDCCLTWDPMVPELAASRRVIAPDLPGHGYSDHPDASYELSWYAHIIERWMAMIGLEQTDVVGHSFGGGVAQMLLLERQRRIRRLGLISSGGLGREISVGLRLAAVPWVVEYFGQPFMAIGTQLALRNASRTVTVGHIAELARMNATLGSARAFARTVQDIIDWRGQRRAFLHRVRELGELPPTAVYWGTLDPIIPAKHGKDLTESVEGIDLTLFEGCGHYVHHEQPLELAQALKAFLDSASPIIPRLRTDRAADADAAKPLAQSQSPRRSC
jgi:pimeloyl-ACP methyl ester carboxylesterase